MNDIICPYCGEDISFEIEAAEILGPHVCTPMYIINELNK